MKELAAGKLVVKNSRFYAHLYKLEKTDEIPNIISLHHEKYKKASHHCYAARFTSEIRENNVELFSDDQEIGRPGRTLLELLKNHGLTQHALVVSRVFGGVKLGAGGVTRAFKEAGNAVILLHLQNTRQTH